VSRPAWAEVDLGAIAANVRTIAELVAPAQVCAVVKADGYGHGAVEVARAALDAGASWLAVALPSEGTRLRHAGIDAPVLLLSEPPSWDEVVASGLAPTVYSERGVAALAGRGARPVHLKVDTGMRRVGVRPDQAVARARQVQDGGLDIEAVWTHCPVADEPANPFTDVQADRFDAVVADLRAAGIDPPLVHAANSAAAIAHPRLRYDLVRVGIAVYGLSPAPAIDGAVPLRPALSLRARVSHVQHVAAGEAVSYGLRRPAPADTVVATVPIGYADGVRRALSDVGEVVVGGERRPFAGTITMDQLLVDCGADSDVAVGDEVVLIGDGVRAEDWAAWLGTITYEVTCGISSRVPRVHR
jgi:alanine racemase